eukprot:4164883-Pyramimonas_sp.AAC.2
MDVIGIGVDVICTEHRDGLKNLKNGKCVVLTWPVVAVDGGGGGGGVFICALMCVWRSRAQPGRARKAEKSCDFCLQQLHSLCPSWKVASPGWWRQAPTGLSSGEKRTSHPTRCKRRWRAP